MFFFLSHLLGRVDVQALVEMLLQVGHHGVVARHAVDARVVQAGGLDHAAAHLHDQRDKLRGSGRTSWKSGNRSERKERGKRRKNGRARGKVENYKVKSLVESEVEAALLSLHDIMHNEIAGSELMVSPESLRVKLTKSV